MKQVFILFLLVFASLYAFSQNNCSLKGKIMDEEGTPIPYANIYIPEVAIGSMTNVEGKFLIPIKCGTYQIKIQRQGYVSRTLTVKAKAKPDELKFKLNTISYQLASVRLDSSSVATANNIIRKAIVMAQYYKEQIKSYNTNLYIRSFYDVDNIPDLIKQFAAEENLAEIQTGVLNETLLQYSYTKPNVIKEKIIARKTVREDTTKTGVSYINLDFYNLGGQNIINPLSRNAFKVYNFEYMGSYQEDHRKIHRIKLIPKRRGSDLMKGYLYINDGLWNINHVDVEFQQQIFQLEYKQRYNEIRPFLWMPINHNIKVSDKALGLQFKLQYLVNLRNLRVKTDSTIDARIKSSLNRDSAKIKNTKSPQFIGSNQKKNSSKTDQKIDDLIHQDELSNRETYKLVRLIKKQRKASDSTKSLEVNVVHHSIKYADSAFIFSAGEWKSMRNIPLTEKEEMAFNTLDSAKEKNKQDGSYNRKEEFLKNLFIFNGKMISKNKKHSFEPNGLIVGLFPYFNTVDGFAPEKTLLDYKWDNRKGKFIKLRPIVGYAVARKTLTGRIEVKSQYNKIKRGQINISGGRKTNGFNRKDPISDRLNTISTTFFTGNVKKLYQQDYLKIDHQIDIINGLVFSLGGDYAYRTALTNNADFQLLDITNRDYTSNIPDNQEVHDKAALIDDNIALTFRAKLAWTPKQYYTFKDNTKILLSSNYPTFSLGYRKGIDGVLNSKSNYDMIHFSVQQSFPLHLIDNINYYVEAGKFLSAKSIYFADYQNFNVAPTFVIDNAKTNGFRLLDYYDFNTKKYYLEGHFSIENDHLILKYLPLLNRTDLDEKLEFSYLYTDRNIHFTEAGLSLTNIFYLMDAGAFVSFKDAEYNSWAIKLAFYFLQ